jgi:hypothetical protein
MIVGVGERPQAATGRTLTLVVFHVKQHSWAAIAISGGAIA